jgi:hypothetical protein
MIDRICPSEPQNSHLESEDVMKDTMPNLVHF